MNVLEVFARLSHRIGCLPCGPIEANLIRLRQKAKGKKTKDKRDARGLRSDFAKSTHLARIVFEKAVRECCKSRGG